MNNKSQRVIVQLLNEYQIDEEIDTLFITKPICKDNYKLANKILKFDSSKNKSVFALCYDNIWNPKFYRIYDVIKDRKQYYVKFSTQNEL